MLNLFFLKEYVCCRSTIKQVREKTYSVEVNGEIDVYTSPKVKEVINALIEEGNHFLVVNLEVLINSRKVSDLKL
jgi:membrane-bound ClpP family serine protease